MTRSILSIGFGAPPSPLWTACGTLPQPRSRMAVAAVTRAAAVASFDRITPTRTLSAVLVWLRASERISVIALAIFDPDSFEACPDIFARRRVGAIGDEVVGSWR